MPEVLPSSNTREQHETVFVRGVECLRLFCANCGVPAPYVAPKAALETGGFNCYLCDGCAESWSPLLGVGLMPDDVFGQRVNAEMEAAEGRLLDLDEMARALTDPSHYLSKLAKDRPRTAR